MLKAAIGVGAGLLGVLFSWIPGLGLALSAAALLIGIFTRRSEPGGLAMMSLTLGIIGSAASILIMVFLSVKFFGLP